MHTGHTDMPSPGFLVHDDIREGYPASATAACAIVSSNMYGDKSEFIKSMLFSGYDSVRYFDIKGTQTSVSFSHKDKLVLIANRGTDGLKSLFDDAEFLLERNTYGQGKVHGGFLDYVGHTINEIVDSLVCADGYRIFVTGHSLGAAAAVIQSGFLSMIGRSVTCIAHACPRVGDKTFAEWIDSNDSIECWRTSNTSVSFTGKIVTDLVTRLPMRAQGYQHTEKVAVYSEGTVHLDKSKWKDLVKKIKVSRWRILSRLLLGLKAHSHDRYIKASVK